VVVGDPALVARLRPLLPHARLEEATLADLDAVVARLGARALLCAQADPKAGLAALQRLRAVGDGAKTLLLTPPDAVETRLAALESGIDEALATPIDDAELAGRLSLLLRRAGRSRPTRLVIADGLELDLGRRELWRDGRWVHLRPKEAGLLELLARSPGRTLTREHILRRVWGPDHGGDPRTVDVHVRWLRSKIEADPHHPVRLCTVRGVGYRLDTAPLTER
jgi:DNA-binding response OmpR family regulator